MSDGRRGITLNTRAAFESHLARPDAPAAVALTVRLLETGVDAEEVLLGLIAPAQVAVGDRWAADEWTVAQEHAATHVSDLAVAAVAAVTAERPVVHSGEVVSACSEGEWHALPARILTEVLRLRGFRTRFLGGHVPTTRLVPDLHQNGSDVVALSCTLPARLPLAYRMIEACRLAGVPVLAGGPGFGPGGVWARTLGADLYAPDAPKAAELLRAQWPPRLGGGPSVDARSAEACAGFARHRAAVLSLVSDRLSGGLAAPSDLTDRRPGTRTDTRREQLGQLLDALAAGVLVDDSRVFTDYLAFLVRLLTARAVSPARLVTVLGILADALRESPRFSAHIAAGRRRVDDLLHSAVR